LDSADGTQESASLAIVDDEIRAYYETGVELDRPEELRAEFEEAGFAGDGVFGVEGPGWLREEMLDDELVLEGVLRVARELEQEPTTIGTSAHLLSIARRA